MSGLCGVLGLGGQPPTKEILWRMLNTIQHRGGNDSGVIVRGLCGLASARQRFQDEDDSARQPMRTDYHLSNPSDNISREAWIVSSGATYNHKDIRAAIEATGQKFSSSSDAETLLYAYLKFGTPNFIKAFRGMFAIAIWDSYAQQLHLVRDRLGQQPLYYVQTDQWLVFGSEIKALLAHPDVPRRLNEAVIPHYLAYGYPPSPQTLFDGIHGLLPGNILTFDLSADTPAQRLESYWFPPYPSSGSDPRSEENITSDLLAHLRGAVRSRIAPGLAQGVLLSGGLDSAALVALLSQESSEPIKTYFASFAGQEIFDDRRHARQIAARYVTDHHDEVFDPNVLEVINTLIDYYDHPFGDPAAVSTYLINRQVSEVTPVVFTGDGGSELFAGYAHFRLARLARSYEQLPSVAHRAIGGVMERLPETLIHGGFMRRANRIVRAVDLPLAERYLSWVRLTPAQWLTALVGGQREQAVREHFNSFFEAPQGGEESDIITQLLDVSLRTYLPDSVLVRLDRCGAAFGLQTRLPFLDHQLLHFVSQIPSRLKLKRGTSKYILKEALANILPESVVERQSDSINIPVDDWFRGELGGEARGILLSEQAASRRIFDTEAVRAMFDAHADGRSDLGSALWVLLTFEMWMQRTF